MSDYSEIFMQVYVWPFSNVATLWRQKSLGSESERQVPAVVFILGCTVSSDLGLKVPQLILHQRNIGTTNFNKRITVSFTLFYVDDVTFN